MLSFLARDISSCKGANLNLQALITFLNLLKTSQRNMRRNEKKCKEMVITFLEYQPSPVLPMFLNGIAIVRVSSFKLLGVTLSNNLSWNDHCNEMLKKACMCYAPWRRQDLTLWTAKLWKSHENVIKKPGKHFSGHWIWRFRFHGLFCMPWIFYKKAVMNFHGSWNCHEISPDGFMTLEKAGVL